MVDQGTHNSARLGAAQRACRSLLAIGVLRSALSLDEEPRIGHNEPDVACQVEEVQLVFLEAGSGRGAQVASNDEEGANRPLRPRRLHQREDSLWIEATSNLERERRRPSIGCAEFEHRVNLWRLLEAVLADAPTCRKTALKGPQAVAKQSVVSNEHVAHLVQQYDSRQQFASSCLKGQCCTCRATLVLYAANVATPRAIPFLDPALAGKAME